MSNFKIRPFKGLLYNQAKVKDLSKVVTPPYDVINEEMQRAFYERSTFNFVRVDLSPEPGDLRYEAAQKVFRQWVNQQVLIRDEKPALYFHHQIFILPDGTQITRKGFFGVRKIEDFSEGGIKPHEKTLEGPKADRLKLTRAVNAQLSPVFSLYADQGKKIDRLILKLKSQTPHFDFTTDSGERHLLWREDNATVCQFVGEQLENEPLFIADGHHRYETALNYRNECRQKNPNGDPLAPYNYVLMYFTNRYDEGLIILPIHRALHHLVDFELIDLIKNLEKHLKVTPLGPIDNQGMLQRLKEEGAESHAFIMMTKDPAESYLLSIKRRAWRHSAVAAPVPASLVGLDVTVLHRLIFEEILRISPTAQAKQENIIYWKDTQKAIDETRKGGCFVTFLLNPTRIEDMEAVANAGEKMPQKSTYFYPKVLSGLVVYPL